MNVDLGVRVAMQRRRAVSSAVHALAHEVGPLGVTVNCVSAGVVDTE